ncbi:MAG: class I SAM-dependent methyltransferase [Chitinophagaceae bacterium]
MAHCLFCESSNIKKAVIPRSTVFNGKTFNYSRCGSCGLVFIDPLPAQEDLAKMYGADYHEEFYFQDTVPDFSYLNDAFSKYKSAGTLLDFGCGDGSFMAYFQQQGIKGTGVEFADTLVEKLQEKFPQSDFLSDESFRGHTKKYNFIHLGDVLEHLETPIDFVRKLTNNLDPGTGVFILEGPLENNGSLSFLTRYMVSWFKCKFFPAQKATHVPYHITFSSAKNQRAFFKYCGLKELHFHTFETSWPYPSTPSGGASKFVQYLIGRVSIGISKVLGGHLGNRFVYIGTPNAPQD